MAAMAAEPASLPSSLEEVLQFPLPQVEARLRMEQGCSPEEAALLVGELKRWLYACARSPQPLSIVPELIPIDCAWHCFILFTRDYEAFCTRLLGRFIHHDPIAESERARFAELRSRDPAEALRQRQSSLRPQLEFIGGLLGPGVLKRWYQDLPAQFHFNDHLP